MIETKTFPGGYALNKYKLLANAPANISKLYLNIKALEPVITSDLSQVSSQLGTSFEGLHYSVKSIDSLENKIEREMADPKNGGKSPYELASGFKDIIRYTEICEHDNIFEVAKSTIDILQKEGYTLSGVKNYYIAPFEDTGYMGLHLNFISPYGQEIELQVHSQESFDAKQQGHSLYEQIRDVSPVPRDKDALEKKVFEIHSKISKPKGFEELVDFKLSPEEKEKIISEGKSKTKVEVKNSQLQEFPFVVISTVKYCDQELYHGFEHCYTDGSINVYRSNENCATMTSLDSKQGYVIVSHPAVPVHENVEHCLMAAKNTEVAHVKWMEAHKDMQKFYEQEFDDIKSEVVSPNYYNENIEK